MGNIIGRLSAMLVNRYRYIYTYLGRIGQVSDADDVVLLVEVLKSMTTLHCTTGYSSETYFQR